MKKLPANRSSVTDFLKNAKRFPVPSEAQSRLVFAMDATQSRAPTWDLATSLHAELFDTAQRQNLSVQLVYYRGHYEFYATHWNDSATGLLRTMQQVRCRGGITQISRVLSHIIDEVHRANLRALVFVGDACEENPQELFTLAGQLGLYRIPVFMLQEGFNATVAHIFSEIARLTNGAHIPFEPGSAQQLAELLRAVAHYATGGFDAVKELNGHFTRQLLEQLRP